jgi:hypothetical protein
MKIPRNLQPYVFRMLQVGFPFRRLREVEQRRVIREAALFSGDIPPRRRSPAIGRVAGASPGTPRNFVCSEDYAHARTLRETYEGVRYTPEGFGWYRGRLDERLSVREVRRLGPLLQRPRRPGLQLATGTLIQAESPNTYGDWVCEQIKCLALAPDCPRPVVLPQFLARRGYVAGELDRLGIEYVAADGAVQIEQACVLRKPTPRTFWHAHEVAAYRALFGLDPEPPRPGSLLYLSREGVRSEQVRAARDYRSPVIAEAVRALGGTVVETAEMGFDDFTALAGEAETVIADHGAAMFNIMQWRPRRVIEMVTDTWWSPCFVFLSVACGTRDHVVLRAAAGSGDELKARVTEAVTQPERSMQA